MRVTVCSIFRDSAAYVDRYLDQMAGLAEHVELRIMGTYGDCTDITGEMLITGSRARDLSMSLYRMDHGGPRYGSVDHPARWDQIAKVVRCTLDGIWDPGAALLWVESDLIWEPETLLALLKDLNRAPTVAPQLLAHGEARWYDTWGYRRDGKQFNPSLPYHDGTPDEGTGLVHIDSCGSCWATYTDFWREWSGHWPFNPPGGLWLDPTLTVWHP